MTRCKLKPSAIALLLDARVARLISSYAASYRHIQAGYLWIDNRGLACFVTKYGGD
jgi:hypothetical protein